MPAQRTPAKVAIVDKDAPILRKTAKPVALKDIKSKKIQDILKHMKVALRGEDDGVAIAAPQIGESLRIFIVSGRVISLMNKKKSETEEASETEADDLVFINPEITKLSRKKKPVEEGCLSVRWLYGQVERSEKATVRAHDENGKPFTKGASGLLAQIFQHETDHLNGILFIDKAENIEDLPPEQDK